MDRRCMGCMETYNDQFSVCPFCGYIHGTGAREAYHITPGSVLVGRYLIGKVLGFGGFGITYIGFDQVLQNKVAIKEYMPGEFSTRMPNQQAVTIYSGEREEQFKEGMLKIIDEARRLAQFKSEPNIVHIFDCFEANNTAYIVMEYLDGKSVKEILLESGRLSVDQALDIVMKVIAALKKVHNIGIIHRDVAPDNIYILKDGSVKILDFGAARYATTKHSKSLSVIIKPGYAPEEQYRSRGDQGPWTDVYALAATFYKMVTGITPEDAMERGVKDLLRKPSKMGVSIPRGVETAVMNALNVRIEDRTQSMEEFETELMAAEVKEKVARQRKSDVGKIPLWAKIAAASGTLIMVVLLVVVLFINIVPKLEYVLPEGKTIVPNMVNQEQEKAVSLGQKQDLEIIADNMKYSAIIPAGHVTNQSVSKGSIVDTGTSVLLEISRGREKVVVRMVIGMAKEDAVKQMEQTGLTVVIKEVSSDTTSPGSVVSQSIEGDTTAVKGDTIVLSIAIDDGKGNASVMAAVPDIVGEDYEEAQSRLKLDFLYLAPVYENSDTVPKGCIISQGAAAGEEIPQKSNIAVVVSLGKEKVQMPLVELTTLAEARTTLEECGLIVILTEEYSDSVQRQKVISQNVEADLMVEKGTEVTLVISLGRRPEPVQTQPVQTQPVQTQPPQPTQPAATQPATTPPPETTVPQETTSPPETTAAPPAETTADRNPVFDLLR